GADHHERGQHDIGEALAAGVEDEQSQKLRGIAVAVDDGIKEGAEAGDAVGGAGDLSIDKVKKPRTDDDESRIAEHAGLVLAVSGPEHESGDGVYDQAEKSKEIRVDAGECQRADNGVQQYTTGASKGAGPRHRRGLIRPPARRG